jgi:hypothetical protein
MITFLKGHLAFFVASAFLSVLRKSIDEFRGEDSLIYHGFGIDFYTVICYLIRSWLVIYS